MAAQPMAQQQPPVSQTQANVQQQASTITNGDEVLGPKLLQLKDLFPSSLRREDVVASRVVKAKAGISLVIAMCALRLTQSSCGCAATIIRRVRPNHVRRPAWHRLPPSPMA